VTKTGAFIAGMGLHSINYTYGRSGLTGEVKMYSAQYNK
jgi:hypothetical protein